MRKNSLLFFSFEKKNNGYIEDIYINFQAKFPIQIILQI